MESRKATHKNKNSKNHATCLNISACVRAWWVKRGKTSTRRRVTLQKERRVTVRYKRKESYVTKRKESYVTKRKESYVTKRKVRSTYYICCLHSAEKHRWRSVHNMNVRYDWWKTINMSRVWDRPSIGFKNCITLSKITGILPRKLPKTDYISERSRICRDDTTTTSSYISVCVCEWGVGVGWGLWRIIAVNMTMDTRRSFWTRRHTCITRITVSLSLSLIRP